MNIFRLILAMLFLASTTFAQDLTLEEIIGKNLEAKGGIDLLKSINSQIEKYDLKIQDLNGSLNTYKVHNKLFRTEITLNGQTGFQLIKLDGAWFFMPFMQMKKPQALPKNDFEMLVPYLDAQDPFIDYKAKKNSFALKGKSTVGGKKVYVIEGKLKGISDAKYYIDTTSFQIVKSSITVRINNQEAETVTTFSNFKKTDFGTTIPYSKFSNKEEQILKSIQYNVEISEDKYKAE